MTAILQLMLFSHCFERSLKWNSTTGRNILLNSFFSIMTGKVEVSVASFNGRLHLLVKLQQLV